MKVGNTCSAILSTAQMVLFSLPGSQTKSILMRLTTELQAWHQETDAHDPQPDGYLKTMQNKTDMVEPKRAS